MPVTHEQLQTHLVWDDSLNTATLPTGRTDEAGEPTFRLFVAHSTLNREGRIVPQLRFDDRPAESQTIVGNVYGTGMYVANRREAAIRRRELEQGREVGAYLTDPVSHREIADNRRRLAADIFHLGSMTVKEMVLAKALGERKTAARFANQADAQMEAAGKRVRLLNEAPRGRLEKMEHEKDWQYDLVPPQYLLARMPLLRIGTFQRPEQQPKQFGVVAMYAKRFWQAAIRNARDMKRLASLRRRVLH